MLDILHANYEFCISLLIPNRCYFSFSQEVSINKFLNIALCIDEESLSEWKLHSFICLIIYCGFYNCASISSCLERIRAERRSLPFLLCWALMTALAEIAIRNIFLKIYDESVRKRENYQLTKFIHSKFKIIIMLLEL